MFVLKQQAIGKGRLLPADAWLHHQHIEHPIIAVSIRSGVPIHRSISGSKGRFLIADIAGMGGTCEADGFVGFA